MSKTLEDGDAILVSPSDTIVSKHVALSFDANFRLIGQATCRYNDGILKGRATHCRPVESLKEELSNALCRTAMHAHMHTAACTQPHVSSHVSDFLSSA